MSILRASLALLICSTAACSDGPGKTGDTANQTTGTTTGPQPTSSYRPAGTFELGLEARTPVFGDFDGDGDLDVAIASQFSSEVHFLVNDGANAFSKSVETFGRTTEALAADFDDDGIMDLALTTDGEPQVKVVLQPLASPLESTHEIPALSLGLAAADFDGDGDTDLAAAVSGTQSEPGGRVAILSWNGVTFDAPSFASVGLQPTRLAALDDDIVVLLGTKSALMLTNDGSGAFAASAPFGLGDGVLTFALIDIDQSGTTDVVSADLTGDSLNAALDFPSADAELLDEVSSPYEVIALNANDDETMDLAFTSVDDRQVIGLVSRPDGTYGSRVLGDIENATRLGGLAAADVDGDGIDDLFVVERKRDEPGTLHLFLSSPEE